MNTDTQLTNKSADEKADQISKSEYTTLNIMGDEYTTLLTKKFETRTKWQKPNEKHIASYIPGTVTDILVKEGQEVNKGDKIIILEAMKMLNTIEMPLNGIIKKIHVKVGERVHKGKLMLEIE